jgi:hypothetical protein
MSKPWSYIKAGQRRGPLGAQPLKELTATGALAPSDLVWRAGMAAWTKAGLIKGLGFDPASRSTTGTRSSPRPPPRR